MAQDCIFCKIAAKEVPAEFVYETDDVIAFPDMNPEAPTHLLIIPKKHISSLAAIAPEDAQVLANIHFAAQELAAKIGLDQGFRLVSNCGEQGGQSVMHLHFHLLGGRDLQWPPG